MSGRGVKVWWAGQWNGSMRMKTAWCLAETRWGSEDDGH